MLGSGQSGSRERMPKKFRVELIDILQKWTVHGQN